MKITGFLLVIVAFMILLVGCSPQGVQDLGTDVPIPETGLDVGSMVVIQDLSFDPAQLTVPVGTAVTWTNMDTVPHTVTSGMPGSPDGSFDSGNMDQGAVFTFTFTDPGTYSYFCQVHPDMVATVIVE